MLYIGPALLPGGGTLVAERSGWPRPGNQEDDEGQPDPSQNAALERLYLPREEGGRGLQGPGREITSMVVYFLTFSWSPGVTSYVKFLV